MKKIILVLLGLMILGSLTLSHAGVYDPFAGTELEGKSRSEISSPNFREQAFPILYQIAEEDPNKERAFNAFSLLMKIYKRLDWKYKNDELQSEELRQMIEKFHFTIENPKTAKEYFYRALFEYPKDGKEAVSRKMIVYFKYVIDNFQNSVYAEFSYIFLARLHKAKHEYVEAENILNEYLKKYGENATLKPYVYYSLATIYSKLYGGRGKRIADPEEKLAFMLEYADKFLSEFTQYKSMVARLAYDVGSYHKSKGDYNKALKYFEKVYNDPEQDMLYLTDIVYKSMKIHVKKNEYKKADDLLEDTISRYSNNKIFREFYKRTKLKLLEKIKFGYDDEININMLNARKITQEEYDANMKIYKKNKEKIEKFREEYEAHFDKDFNIIKPFKEEKEEKEPSAPPNSK